MTGRTLMLGMLIFAAIFAAGLYYMQVYAFYEEIEADAVEVAGTRYPVTGWQGIDASTSPLKLRACFRMAAAPEAPVAETPVPLVAPGWFDCFDAEAIARALDAGEATAYLAAAEDRPGADRILVRFPDGRAFMWRQLTPEFANQ
ncbi:DUF6446 family protein [Paralimibaculum aggregatum]|uniref:DUF6446 family protein n=1 Tax=Paralimibaculum aggregatum TaxID=3036245 RepID=A0ABQ6LHZ2_9RHOB|nr:DUF6446 family protein [Limibaculum sp. NKW23]GMG81262.1 DUF6446 family protein [Limibaculum sp. NKW23]